MKIKEQQMLEYEAKRDAVAELEELKEQLEQYQLGLTDATQKIITPVIKQLIRDITKQKDLIEEYEIEKFAGTNPLG